MGSTAEHQALVKEILIEFGSKPYVRLWANNTGAVATKNRYVKFGLKGSSDIIGILNTGQFIGIEVKTGKSKQSPGQIAFQNMLEKFGGVYILARSTKDVQVSIRQYSFQRQ